MWASGLASLWVASGGFRFTVGIFGFGLQCWWVPMGVDLLWWWLWVMICGGFVVGCLGLVASGCGFRYGFGFVVGCLDLWSVVVGFDMGLNLLLGWV